MERCKASCCLHHKLGGVLATAQHRVHGPSTCVKRSQRAHARTLEWVPESVDASGKLHLATEIMQDTYPCARLVVQCLSGTQALCVHHTAQIVEGLFEIQSVHSGRFLNVKGGGKDNGSEVWLWDNRPGANPHNVWRIIPIPGKGPNTVEILSVHAGRLLNLDSHTAMKEGAKVRASRGPLSECEAAVLVQ